MALGLGFSFGSKKKETNTTSSGTKLETLLGTENTTTTGAKSSTGTSSSQGTSSTTGTQTNTGNQTQNTSGQETGKQSSTTTTLGGDIQQAISDRVKALLGGGINDQSMTALSSAITGAGNFNPADYVKSAVDSATFSGRQAQQEQQSAIQSAIGGTAGTNSMAALLAQRGEAQFQDTLSKTRNEAAATAAGINNQNIGAIAGASNAVTSQADALAQVLKGATTTSDVTTLTSQIQQLLGQNTTQQANTQNTATSEQQQTQTMDLISQIVNALTNKTQTTVANETTNTKEKSSGFGISASL